MAKKRVMLTFAPEVSAEPIIFTMGQQFKLVTNIHRADASEDKGWIEVELEGTEKNIEAGIAWATSKGVRVSSIGEDIAKS